MEERREEDGLNGEVETSIWRSLAGGSRAKFGFRNRKDLPFFSHSEVVITSTSTRPSSLTP